MRDDIGVKKIEKNWGKMRKKGGREERGVSGCGAGFREGEGGDSMRGAGSAGSGRFLRWFPRFGERLEMLAFVPTPSGACSWCSWPRIWVRECLAGLAGVPQGVLRAGRVCWCAFPRSGGGWKMFAFVPTVRGDEITRVGTRAFPMVQPVLVVVLTSSISLQAS
jgi:hypothetical protein